MTVDHDPMHAHPPAILTLLLLCVLPLGAETRAEASTPTPAAPPVTIEAPWVWPVDGARSGVNPYRAPAHVYGSGHRGIDIATGQGLTVQAPADGVVAFRGTVVDRPLLTIEHAGGYVSTLEPVVSDLSPGEIVSAGDTIGAVSVGGHAQSGMLHLGVRLGGAYINPMLLFEAVPRSVLLPCCDPL